ncbi:uncharacterized protein NEMAJ01_0269 [Nematocida major]|uniref:uncharacterized protein n=1 Tax=Nematocida major TaxID=1912982 RepID=UPI002008B9F0|nr:uncharacterized protein NEMAJ01_0269 [Nematocida major]KAH9385373.1 hypothetical protein NEMAJ01_0269 [Nematocida major]
MSTRSQTSKLSPVSLYMKSQNFKLILLFLVQAFVVNGTKPLTFTLNRNSPEIRSSVSALISEKIRIAFRTQFLPYIPDGLTGMHSYYTAPERTELFQHLGTVSYYNVYTRKNNESTYAHCISVRNAQNEEKSVEIIIKIFRDKVSFSAMLRGSPTGNAYEVVNRTECAVLEAVRSYSEIDEFQLRRLVAYAACK